MAEIWMWHSQQDYDDWVNELLEHAPESYDGDEAAEAIVLAYIRDLEGTVAWFFDHLAVIEHDDGYSLRGQIATIDTPDPMWRLLRGYVDAREVAGQDA